MMVRKNVGRACAGAVLVALALSTGCAYHAGETPKEIVTDVRLGEANFDVVAEGLLGQDFGIRVFGIGTSATYFEAMNKVRTKAGLRGGPKALVNVTEDLRRIYWFGIVTTETLEISADVVEFREPQKK